MKIVLDSYVHKSLFLPEVIQSRKKQPRASKKKESNLT